MHDGPKKEHLWLAKATGVWDVVARYFVSAGAEPIDAKGTERVEMLGAYWRIGALELDVLDSPVRGRSCLGFDSLRRAFVGTWFDTSTPFLYAYEGQLDEKANVLTMIGLNTDPSTGKQSTYRSVERFALPDRRELSLFVKPPDDAEMQILSYAYTRRG